MLDLSIIIVNWNSSRYLEKCLETIVSNSGDLKYEVIVVDNASYDGCDQVVNKFKEVVSLVQSDKNLGFAKANNLGVRHAKGKYLLFLNPDTEILGNTLTEMLGFMSSETNVGCLGCKVLNSDGTIQTSCVQAFPTITNQFFDSDFLRKRYPELDLWGMKALYDSSQKTIPVETIAGSCLMIANDVFKVIGQFTEDYFMFAEDRDLCFKAHASGYRNYYMNNVSIIHHGGGSTRDKTVNFFSAVAMKEATFCYFSLNRPGIYPILYRGSTAIASAIRIAFLLLSSIVAIGNRFRLERLFGSIRKWESIFLWSVRVKKLNIPGSG
jgi:GT2 family glycosyltransferase